MTVNLKIARQDRAHFIVKVTSLDPNYYICGVRIVGAGANIPCASQELVKTTNTQWLGKTGYQIVEADLGVLVNFGKLKVKLFGFVFS